MQTNKFYPGIATTLVVFVAGFVAGTYYHGSSNQLPSNANSSSADRATYRGNLPEKTKSPKLDNNFDPLINTTLVQDEAGKDPDWEAGRAAVGGTSVFVAPAEMLHFVMPAFISPDGLSLNSASIAPYGLGGEKASVLCNLISEKAKFFAQLEATHAELVTDDKGNSFYKVSEFSVEGKQIKQEIEKLVDEAFLGIKDDRKMLFLRQLYATPLFSDFGTTAKEISIEEVPGPGGEISNALSVVRFRDGVEVDHSTNTLKSNLINTRYRFISEKFQHNTK